MVLQVLLCYCVCGWRGSRSWLEICARPSCYLGPPLYILSPSSVCPVVRREVRCETWDTRPHCPASSWAWQSACSVEVWRLTWRPTWRLTSGTGSSTTSASPAGLTSSMWVEIKDQMRKLTFRKNIISKMCPSSRVEENIFLDFLKLFVQAETKPKNWRL